MLTRQKYIQAGQLQLRSSYISPGGGAGAIVLSLQSRVITDLGTFEAYDCLYSTIQSLLSINIA